MMFENLIFAALVIIALAAGVWVWWMESHDSKQEQTSAEKEG